MVNKSHLKRYVYKLPDELVGNVKVGDYVCVHCANGYNVCEVVTVNAITPFDDAGIEPVLCKVDISGYIARIEKKKQQQSLLQRSLSISKKEFEFANALIQSDWDKLLCPEQSEVSIPSEILEMLEKLKGDNHDEG